MATAYKVMHVDLKTDTSLGTFTDGPRIYGAIIGVAYTLEATNDAGKKSMFSSDFFLTTPQLALPTVNALKMAIRNDAASKSAKVAMDASLAKDAVNTRSVIPIFGEDIGF